MRAQAQRQGRGRALMGALAAMLRERGLTSLGLWVLRENAGGRACCACLGGRPGGEHREIQMGHAIIETAYVWPYLVTVVGA